MTMRTRLDQWLAQHSKRPYTKASLTLCKQLGLHGKAAEEQCWVLLDAFDKEDINKEDLLQGMCLISDLTPEEVVKRLAAG